MARTSLRSRRRLFYECLLEGAIPCRQALLFCLKNPERKQKEICHVTDDHQGNYSVRSHPGTAGCPAGRISGGRGRPHPGCVRVFARAVRRCPGGGLGRRADPPVLCGSAPPCAPVPHAGDGHGPAPAGLAERIRLSHRGPVRGHRLRPGDLQPPGPGADCKRDHAGVHVLLSPHGRHADPDGGTGEGRRHRLRGQGEHGPERCPRPVGGDHRGVQA